MTLCQSLSDELCNEIRVEGRDINKVVKDFNQPLTTSCTEGNSKREDLQTKLSEVREEAESNPSQEANLSLQHAKAKYLRHKREAQRKSWKKKTASLNLERDDRKLWRLPNS